MAENWYVWSVLPSLSTNSVAQPDLKIVPQIVFGHPHSSDECESADVHS